MTGINLDFITFSGLKKEYLKLVDENDELRSEIIKLIDECEPAASRIDKMLKDKENEFTFQRSSESPL